MVIHYQPGRLRRNSDQPTAITNVLAATRGSSHHTGDIPLGMPTCSARSRRGLWALYPHGTDVVVVWPGGALAGNPAKDLVEPGQGLLAQRPHQPTRPQRPHAIGLARGTSTSSDDAATT